MTSRFRRAVARAPCRFLGPIVGTSQGSQLSFFSLLSPGSSHEHTLLKRHVITDREKYEKGLPQEK